MSTRLNDFRGLAPFGILVCATIVAFVVVPSAFANSPFDIEFPISELGNCQNKAACKSYCDNDEHADACKSFAEKHGLGATREEVDVTLKQFEEDGGPGGCAADAKNPARACRAYCDNIAHIDECLSYAKKNGLMETQELQEAEKVSAALKRGAKLPAQCTNAASCKTVCEDPADLATARACFEFGKEAGLLPPEVSEEQAEKVFEAFANGKTPFKSFAEMRQCDNPSSDELMEKCVNFALEAGLIPPEEVEIVKKTKGRGPGNCRGRAECEAYCENPDNAEQCFKFAEEHGMVREEDRERMREGLEEMRDAVEDADPEVLGCIRKDVPGFDAMLAGEKLPSPKVGELMRQCFENFFRNQADGSGGHGENGGFGEMENSGREDERFDGGPGEFHDGPEGFQENPGADRGIPPEVKACLSEKFGDTFLLEVTRGGRPQGDAETKMRECFKETFGESREGNDHPSPESEQREPRGDRNEMSRQKEIERLPENPDGAERQTRESGGSEEHQKQYQEQFDQKFQEEYRRQYEEQYQKQFEAERARQMEQGHENRAGEYQEDTRPPSGTEDQTPRGDYPPPGTETRGGEERSPYPPPPNEPPPPPVEEIHGSAPSDMIRELANVYFAIFGVNK